MKQMFRNLLIGSIPSHDLAMHLGGQMPIEECTEIEKELQYHGVRPAIHVGIKHHSHKERLGVSGTWLLLSRTSHLDQSRNQNIPASKAEGIYKNVNG